MDLRASALPALAIGLLLAVPARAQTPPLSLADAIARARSANTAARAASVQGEEAEARVARARAGWLPRVDAVETWQRGNQPVFAFGSLLAQRRFAQANFAIDALNRPDAVDNFRTALTAEQTLFDGGATRAAVATAEAGRDLARLVVDRTARDLAYITTEAFGEVLRLEADLLAAESAVRAAEEDLRRARLRQEVGLLTAADVLAIDVHLASSRAREIRSRAEARIARARLNEVIGAPLDAEFRLESPLVASVQTDMPALEAEALRASVELKQSVLGQEMARLDREAAKAAFLPHVVWQSGWEWNGGTFGSRSGSWVVGTQLRLNVFRGFADRARLAETDRAIERAAIERERADVAVRLDVRSALARLDAARSREAVGRAAVAQARESQRIIRDRYENGLADVTELLRSAEALLQAESQETAARVDVLIESAGLDRALGR